MNEVIVQSSENVVLIGGGTVDDEDVELALSYCNAVVAADSGLHVALDAGQMPVAVIGDFDSATPAMLDRVPPDRLHRITEQDSTDFDKALRSIDCPLVLGVGFLGRRVDHQLSVFHTMLHRADRPCVLIGRHECVLLAPPRIDLALQPGDTVSLFPLVPVSGTSDGLRWPIDGLDFSPDTKIGTSNQATGPVRLGFDRPGMLLILPRARLGQVIAARQPQSSGPARWPVRA